MAVKNDVGQVVAGLLASNYKRVTKFLGPKHIVRATRSHPRDRRNTRETVLVTVGVPNYAERKIIKKATRFPFLREQAFPVKRG